MSITAELFSFSRIDKSRIGIDVQEDRTPLLRGVLGCVIQ